MKKYMGVIALVLVAFVIGFFVGDSVAINRVNKGIEQSVSSQQDNKTEAEDTEEADQEQQDKLPIDLDDIMPEITILEPNSIGTVYMDATYTNNSQYPITSYKAKILLKDKNETTYLSTHDTVLPGETSPNFDCFGPDTRDPEDYEILILEVRAKLDNGETLYIEYDLKLNEAKWSEY